MPQTVKNRRIGFLGPVGTYSHQAALQGFDSKCNELIPQATIYDCIHKLIDGKIDYGVVPFENSTNGSVNFTLDILRDIYHKRKQDSLPQIGLVAEEFVAINHCLITEATDLSQIERVYSHPQVWGQVDVWYDGHLKGIEKIDTSSTSRAVQMVKGDPTSAAIAGMSAAEVFGVPVLQPGISNSTRNQTRFLIFANSDLTAHEKLFHSGEYNTLLSFTVDHYTPGALCNALGAFAKQQLNLTSIVSRPRPSGDELWTYVWFIELHGHQCDSAVSTALKDMEKYCPQVRVLGSFKRNR
ncbi:probable prephenate dehydratase [Trichomonascus vanleenenianus]|uniref:prephenate dehydratase PHA2 n=1 Tax=Trichomonascus vanleenenianus TaxID=2268995 RepID=UPI003ECAA02C